jgi:hypothetical protein
VVGHCDFCDWQDPTSQVSKGSTNNNNNNNNNNQQQQASTHHRKRMPAANANETYCTFTLASDVTAGGLPSEDAIAKDLESHDTEAS